MLKTLTPADCPLVPAGRQSLIGDFNRMLADFEALKAEAKGIVDFQERLEEIASTLRVVGGKLTRSHYRVGFLGTTQAGKSTTINNLLGVTEADAPCKSGKGDATTAAPSRVRKSKTTDHGITLRYMLQKEYEKRRDDLRAYLGIGLHLNEQETLAACSAFRDSLRPDQPRPAQTKDYESLEMLIRSHARNSDFVRDSVQRQEVPAVFAERGDYLNHPDDGPQADASQYRLLWDAVVTLNNSVLPANLEMVDLPGLGAEKFHDTCVTMDVLENKTGEELDGCLVFLRSDYLSDASVIKILETLRKAWEGRFQRRVWVIFTKYDVLGVNSFNPANSWFDSAHRVLENNKIDLECCFIVCNELVSALAKSPGLDESARMALGTSRYHRPFDDPALQTILKRLPAFEPILRDTYVSGGLNRLRDAVVNRLSSEIATEVCEDVDRELSKARAAVEFQKKMLKRRRTQSDEDRDHATACVKAINRVLQQFRQGLPELKKATPDLVTGLRDIVKKHSPVDDLKDLPQSEVPKTFRQLAKVLDRDIAGLVVTKGCEPAYKKISEAFKDLKFVPVQNQDSVQTAWTVAMSDATDPDWWKDRLPKFAHADLITKLVEGPTPLRPDDFDKLLDEKIRLVTHESVQLIKNRLSRHLDALRDEMSLLT